MFRLPFFVGILFFSFFLIAGEGPENETAGGDVEVVGQDSVKPDETAEESLIRERVQVLGSAENARRTPGSAHYISKEDLQRREPDDIHRVLREVPGINIQEEDGYGLRPNIGMRGTGVERSQKITIMEDGILIAPAPYTAPAAYYFPTTGRMESIEVLKGSSSIKQGPYTNGGSINLISRSIPGDFSADLSAAGGSHGTQRFKAAVGDSSERFGWLVEGYSLDTDGFKDLDSGGDTGVDLKDYTGKLRFNSSADARVYQSLEFKIGKTEQFGEETYLGLTDRDFALDANRRYAASSEDWIDTDHDQFQARYFVKPNAGLDLTTTIYRNDYFRNWHKLGRVNGVSPGAVLASPEVYASDLAVLRGEVDSLPGALEVRNNRREYYGQGIQSVVHWEFAAGGSQHALEFGVRYHEDEEDRFQEDENFQMVDGRMVLTSLDAPGSQANRLSEAEALSFFIQDVIEIGNWSFKPGLRFEQIDYTRTDYAGSDPERIEPTRIRRNDVDVFLPGLGVDYRLGAHDRIFAGIHKGFSPPGAGRNEETEEETSINYEIGYRHTARRLRIELIGFFNDYDNLLGADTGSGGGEGTGDLFNGGEVEVSGLEAGLAYDLVDGRDFRMPFHMSYTLTTSEFQSTFDTSFADWAPHVNEGDELPYIPEHQMSAGLGLYLGGFSADLTGSYVDEMRTSAGQGSIPVGEEIESHTVFDLSVAYRLDRYKLFAHVRNLSDETYIVSRRPYGVRPGLERTLILGASARF